MTLDCSHCVAKTEHPGFVMLVEALATGALHWTHSSQPLRALPGGWRLHLLVGPFSPPERATQFCSVLQRCAVPRKWAHASALSLARKWAEIQGAPTAPQLHLYGDDDSDAGELDDAHRTQLVHEAVRVVSAMIQTPT